MPFGIIAASHQQSHQCLSSTFSADGDPVLIRNGCPSSELLGCFGLQPFVSRFQRPDLTPNFLRVNSTARPRCRIVAKLAAVLFCRGLAGENCSELPWPPVGAPASRHLWPSPEELGLPPAATMAASFWSFIAKFPKARAASFLGRNAAT